MNFFRKIVKSLVHGDWVSGMAVGMVDGFASQVRGF